MKGLVRFISFALNAVISYLAIAFARAFFVRLPPRNYRTACSTSANERRRWLFPDTIRRLFIHGSIVGRPLIEWKKDNLSTPFDVYVDDVPISQTLRPKPLDFVENDFCVYTVMNCFLQLSAFANRLRPSRLPVLRRNWNTSPPNTQTLPRVSTWRCWEQQAITSATFYKNVDGRWMQAKTLVWSGVRVFLSLLDGSLWFF